jgi:hypothetical protein
MAETSRRFPTPWDVSRGGDAQPSNHLVQFCQEEGYRHLAGLVVEEIDRLLERSGPRVARLVFNLRRQ